MRSASAEVWAAELERKWNYVAIIVGFRGTEILGHIPVFAEDEAPPRAKSWQELWEEISALEDQNGVPLCIIAFKEYEPLQVQFVARSWGDFTNDPWAKRTFESFLEDFFNRQTEKGAKIGDLNPEKLH